jgi:hypothetical protein
MECLLTPYRTRRVKKLKNVKLSLYLIIYLSTRPYTECPKKIFWEVIVSVILSKEVYMYMCPIPNGFRDTAISLYISKIVDKKEVLRTVSNTGIYCSSDKVGTPYIV